MEVDVWAEEKQEHEKRVEMGEEWVISREQDPEGEDEYW